ncbi:MAG: helicase-exonuclease AddAB subunit AddB [Lachnospiraceae bacterium]|nr:helicase-exonuclease AddAB subunit AddB [Lachnospiraceae bacterium]
MSLQFYMGGSGAGKSYRAYKEIIQKSIEEPQTKFFVIVPDQFTMQTQKDLVMMHPNRGIMNIDVLSFGRLAHRIFEDHVISKDILDDTGKSLVLRLVANQCKDELPVIGGNLNKIGYIHEVKSAISEFMQYGIGLQELDEMISYCAGRKALQYKLKDLSVIYRHFMEYISERFMTTEETLDLLAGLIAKSDLLKDSVVLFDGFTGFTPVQNHVIEEVLKTARQVKMTCLIGAEDEPYEIGENNQLFYLSKKTIASISKIAKDAGVEKLEDVFMTETPVYRHKDNKAFAFLESRLFRYGKNAGVYEDSVDHSICIEEASNPKEEVKNLCNKIKACIMENDLCYRDIAVVTGDLETYAHYIEEEFVRQQIPFYMDQTKGIVLNPFTEYIRSGLQIVLQNFNYDSVFHFLRSGLSGMQTDEIDLLENYCIALGIRGKNRWNSLFTRKTGNMKDDTEQLEVLNHARERFMQLLEPLLKGGSTAKDYVLALYTFIEQSDVENKLAEYAARFNEQGDYAREKEYSQIYGKVMELLEQICSLLVNEPMTLQEFADILDAGLGEIEIGTIPQNVDRVVVGDMERTRLKEIKVLLCLGVNDGIIPKNSKKGGIISDIDREMLASGEWEIAPSPRQQMYIQRLYLYMNLTKPTDKLYLSYSVVDAGGKVIRPSYLIEQFTRLFSSLTVKKLQTQSMSDRISTRREGENVFVDYLSRYATLGEFRNEKEKAEFYTLFDLLADEKKEYILKLINRAYDVYKHHPLSKAVAEYIYGKTLENSVSRLEKFASCAYSHFLQYGMALKEREEYSFETKDMGNLYHYILDYFSGLLVKRGYTWFDFTKEAGEEMLDQAIDACAADYQAAILYSSERNLYIFKRLKRVLRRSIFSLQHQLKKGLFTPESFEVSFLQMEDLESVSIALSKEEKMRLKGRIDRVDVCEKEEQIYVKVIDFKSGDRDFDLVAVYHGLSLQLVVYMNAAMEMERKKNPEKEVIPAALLYYKVSDPLVERNSLENGQEETAEEIDARIRKELCMTGIVNSDKEIIQMLDTEFTEQSEVIPVSYTKSGGLKSSSSVISTQDFKIVSDYVSQKIRKIGEEILAGNIEINPYESTTGDACRFCPYHSICGFDANMEGCSKRKIESAKDDEILIQMQGSLCADDKADSDENIE